MRCERRRCDGGLIENRRTDGYVYLTCCECGAGAEYEEKAYDAHQARVIAENKIYREEKAARIAAAVQSRREWMAERGFAVPALEAKGVA